MGIRLQSLGISLPLVLLPLLLAPQPAFCGRTSAELVDAVQRLKPVAEWSSLWDVSDIPDLDELQFKAQTRYLLDMCYNAYNYDYQQASNLRQPVEALTPILGWHLSETVSPLSPSSAGTAGLHALVYEEDPKPLQPDSTRVVIVFPGWQISSTTRSELADLCAGELVFPRYTDFLSPLPHLCSSFHQSSLDYLSQAIAYTRTVLSCYSASSVLLTGHSFGAGLAVLVSAALQAELHESCSHHSAILKGISTTQEQHKVGESCRITLPVISFSGPGTGTCLSQHGWTLYNEDSVISISHDWDFFGVRAQWMDHRGWLCLYGAEEPDSCKDCFSDEMRASSLALLKPRALNLTELSDGGDNNGHMDDHDDDCSCQDEDEPCWECLTDTHAVDSVITAAENTAKPTCTYFG